MPAKRPIEINRTRLAVTGSLKTMIPRTANGILLAAPTIAYVVGEVADMHQNTEKPIPKPINELIVKEKRYCGSRSSTFPRNFNKSPFHIVHKKVNGVATNAL
mmetsp:Transcript_39050/g.74959  ORF Transcript_39050/g.74959 Transcript_39050/m.74959 type:complete len:103 (+) Transcript_39050:277-585(+)